MAEMRASSCLVAFAVIEIWWRIQTVPRPIEPLKQIITSE